MSCWRWRSWVIGFEEDEDQRGFDELWVKRMKIFNFTFLKNNKLNQKGFFDLFKKKNKNYIVVDWVGKKINKKSNINTQSACHVIKNRDSMPSCQLRGQKQRILTLQGGIYMNFFYRGVSQNSQTFQGGISLLTH
jgi:hypothetical protein